MLAATRSLAWPSLASVPLLGLLTAAIYSNTLDVPFVFDDTQNIVENPGIRVASASPAELWRVAVDSPKRPVAFVSFALNERFGSDRIYGYHVVNCLIHIVNGVLVFLLAAACWPGAQTRRTVGFAGRAPVG